MTEFPCSWRLHASPVRPGYWLVRERLGQRKWGPLLPAAITWVQTLAEPGEPTNKMQRSGFWAASVGDEPVSIWSLQQETHTFGDRIYRREREIDQSEFNYRIADLRWATEHAPHEAQTQPRLPFILATAPPIYRKA